MQVVVVALIPMVLMVVGMVRVIRQPQQLLVLQTLVLVAVDVWKLGVEAVLEQVVLELLLFVD
jgi:hypothetical protein